MWKSQTGTRVEPLAPSVTLGYLRPRSMVDGVRMESQCFPGLHGQVIYETQHKMSPFRKQDKTFSLSVYFSWHIVTVSIYPHRCEGPLKIEERGETWLGEGSLVSFHLSKIPSPLWTR